MQKLEMQKLEEYLGDTIFVDYFNAFLSLPIFSTRFIYRPRCKTFEVDTYLGRIHQIDKTLLCTWISRERIPLFWKTDLFLDYLLCKLLISKVEQGAKKEVTQMIDVGTVRKHIGNLIGMQSFRHYTNGSIGQRILSFWYDAEKFRRHSTPDLRRFAFRDIQHKYLKNGSTYELPDAIKDCIYGDGKADSKVQKKTAKDIFSEDIFVAAQEMVVDHLCSYWVPKYILHKCRDFAATCRQRRASRASLKKQLKEINPKYARTTGRKLSIGKPPPSPVYECIQEDEEFEQEKDEFFERNRVSSTESGENGRRSFSFLPEIKRSSIMEPGSPEAKKTRSASINLPTIKSTRTSLAAVYRDQDQDPQQDGDSLQRRQPKITRLFDIKESMKPSIPFAMLGDVNEKKPCSKFRKIQDVPISLESSTVKQAVNNASATNIARFTKPTYYEDIPKTPLCPFQRASRSSMQMSDRSEEEKLFIASITADRLAGGPFKDYLKANGETTILSYLMFWEDVQIYARLAQSTTVDLKFRQGRNIKRTYLQPGFGHEIELEPSLCERVLQLLRKGQASDLLTRIGDRVIQLLHESWKNFLADDDERFHGLLELQELRSNVPVNLEELSAEEVKQNTHFRMYRALDLALDLEQGDFQTPDVEEDTASGDSEDEEQDEGSLRQGHLPILNEEAAVALALSGFEEEVYQNTRRNSHFYGRINRKPRKSSLFNSAAFKVRPPKPRKFMDALSDTLQILWLKRFLVENGAILPLKFWLDVEKMKTQSKDSRARQTKTRTIVKSYFANTDDPGKNLQCKADIIKEIPRIQYVTPAMLVSAQACVIRSLEENWFAKYQSTFPEDAEEEVQKYAPRNTLMAITKMASSGKTRGLWLVFMHCLTAFVMGVKRPESRAKFLKFLNDEAHSPAENKRNPNAQRKIINNRVISADRLVNDLKFWVETQRFKAICDGASACAMAGNYTVDDETLIQHKAQTILQCYIDSELPPRIQINIPQEMADSIHQLWTTGCADRGLFYNAEVYVFCNLIHYWKKFSAKNENPAESKAPEKKARKKTRAEVKKPEKEVLYLEDMPYKRITLGPDDDPHPRLSYSLAYGLKIVTCQL